MPVLSRFNSLRHFAVGDVGFTSCGWHILTPWLQHSDPEDREELEQKRNEMEQKIANMVFGGCKSLELLCICNRTQVRVTRGAHGGVVSLAWRRDEKREMVGFRRTLFSHVLPWLVSTQID
ncbi:hypothetical protein H2199_004208 [Coniosporium tulheliwenetii]|uniref:Uncharacterized protein n=1 Tax=Coniosporium tulheliwenetii TaxID=3383036 RepID=A0ACC2Z762_9PEZI|nr:hypothetical protein H2199_004208 [Cladosporium sp. JES 115]